ACWHKSTVVHQSSLGKSFAA
ncbi:hypothetical protein D039_2942B, partial [Vibrio parahaemolyticus EKP-028]